MTHSARDLLRTTTAALAPDPDTNPLVPRIAAGTAPRTALAALALEQTWVIPADRRAFEHLAVRSAAADPAAAAFFSTLAQGEALAGERLLAFARACSAQEASYEPLPGCQAYPAYVAWLALNAAPADVVLALTANFSAWGGYCATIATALREHYGFTDEACAFFDFFAEPSPDLDRLSAAAVEAALDAGRLDEERAHTYGRLLQTYEAMFWDALSATP
ncbi:transcriptional regulator [Streptomyces sp. SID5643]|uniref:transcriptional regulator n=1 Tax=Streptomyces sp. SID5643 TaxID=2690307 RepID=UPI00136F1A79|nr:transcriptional regulator [Streptomyces sp. SID5643]MZF89024.1 transcriptional regulator [Streptomyces sp. SID5643]